MFLNKKIFSTVIDSTPLISIDLVIRDHHGEVLLGKRNNRPAQGFWFVPGGRIYKNEPLACGFKRLMKSELGFVLPISDAYYIGLFEHFYEDSVLSKDISTHYIVNAFEVVLSESQSLSIVKTLPKEQHQAYSWFSDDDLLKNDQVHLHTKWYFQSDKGFR